MQQNYHIFLKMKLQRSLLTTVLLMATMIPIAVTQEGRFSLCSYRRTNKGASITASPFVAFLKKVCTMYDTVAKILILSDTTKFLGQ